MSPKSHYPRHQSHQKQSGVVLIIALILLMLMSMITAYSVRNAGSSSQVSGNNRAQALAMQAAEAALGHCEFAVENHRKGIAASAGTASMVPMNAPSTTPLEYQWQDIEMWDGAGTDANVTVLTATDMNDAGKLYKRFPECMAQYVQAGNTQRIVVTARGFGPEVPSDATRSAPTGSEVWLQSTLSLP